MSYDEDWINRIVHELEQCPIGSEVADKAKRMIEAAKAEKPVPMTIHLGGREYDWPQGYPKVICTSEK